MKRKNIRLLFICLILLCFGRLVNAQSATPEVMPKPLPPLHFVINAGYTLPNVAGENVASQGTGSNPGSLNAFYFEIGYAYSQKGVVSLYFSDAQGATGNYYFQDSTTTYSYNYTVNIATLGISTLYDFTKGTRFSPYIGCMIGYRFINIEPNGVLPGYGSANVNLAVFAYQAYAGASFYFNKWLGLDARAGYGNSYYVQVGLTFRFLVNRDDY